MTNEKRKKDNMKIGDIVAKVEHYTYLRQQIIMGKVNQEIEINARINKTCPA